MKLTDLDEALRFALPLRFTLAEVFATISDAPKPTKREERALGDALRVRGYDKHRTMRGGKQEMLWSISEPALEQKIDLARIAWERAAAVELTTRQHYQNLRRAIR